jgi:hypothetical protein
MAVLAARPALALAIGLAIAGAVARPGFADPGAPTNAAQRLDTSAAALVERARKLLNPGYKLAPRAGKRARAAVSPVEAEHARLARIGLIPKPVKLAMPVPAAPRPAGASRLANGATPPKPITASLSPLRPTIRPVSPELLPPAKPAATAAPHALQPPRPVSLGGPAAAAGGGLAGSAVRHRL